MFFSFFYDIIFFEKEKEMKNFLNIILSILAIVFLILIFIPTNFVNRKAGVYMEHEWDKLENVIVGSPKLLMISSPHKNMNYPYLYSKKNPDAIKNFVGKPLPLADLYFYGKLLDEIDALVKILKDENIQTCRLNPEVLDVQELRYMKNIQQGNNFVYPRDSVLVIGNNVIETAVKIPNRIKDKFIIRRIFSPLINADASLDYVSMPSPSPSDNIRAVYLEGSDVLQDGKNIYVGVSEYGTNMYGADWLKRYLGSAYKVYPIKIKNYHHLNSVLSFVRPKLAIRVSSAFSNDLPIPLRNWEFIEVNPEDGLNFAASVFVLGNNKVLVDNRFESLIEQLRAKNLEVIPVKVDAISQLGDGLASVFQPIRRSYDKDINRVKINGEFFKSYFLNLKNNIDDIDLNQKLLSLKLKITNMFKK